MSIATEPLAPRPDGPPLALPAGQGQELVVYSSGDVGGDLDVAAFYAMVAADAARRAEAGQRIVTMTATPTRTRRPAMSMGDTSIVDRLTVAVVYSSLPW